MSDADHLGAEALLAYWLGDADATATDGADKHLMACDRCGQALDDLIALGEAVRAAMRSGTVPVVTGAAFVQRLAAHGARLREYRVDAGGSVNCTVAPDDDLLVTRLAGPLRGVRRLDLRQQLDGEPETVLHDVPFDADAAEVVIVAPIAAIRQLPAHTMSLTLQAVDDDGARDLGRYTFHHRPWAG